jgi:hypothetical protein
VRALIGLLAVGEGPLTADFQRVYNLRLQSVVLDREPDEIFHLVKWLPPDCAYFSHAAHPENLERARALYHWSEEKEILLQIFNVLQHSDYVHTQSGSKTKVPMPDPVPSPRSEVQKAKANDANSIAMSLLKKAKERG